jgi:heat shock protein 1/8
MVLSKMKATAEGYLGCEVTKAVITVPAYFNDSQRQATKDAGKIAGLEVLRIINEPTAAALAYGLDKRYDSAGEKHVLIFDLGGGTFDVSLLSLDEGLFTVKATAGDTHLGGDDFDQCLVKFCQDHFKKKHNKDISKDVRAITQLLKACETAKRTLSTATHTVVEIPSLYDGIDFTITIRAAQFEELCQSLFEATLIPVEKVLRDAKLETSQVDEVVLVGGSTRVPKVRKMISEYFGGRTLNVSINADEAVAYGAAAQGAKLSGVESAALAEILLNDVVPLSLGIAVENTAKSKRGQDNRILKTLIPRNTNIPITAEDTFTTSCDDQREAQIEVYQGERTFAKDNHCLGKFRLGGLPKAKAGTLRIKVTYMVDDNGILTVSAEECSGAAKPKVMTIKSDNMRLTERQIERMIAEAQRFEARDKALAARQVALNDLEVSKRETRYYKFFKLMFDASTWANRSTLPQRRPA